MQDIVGGDYKNLLKDIKEDINKWKEIYSWIENKISREMSILYQDTIDSSKITPKIVLFYYYYFLGFWQDDYKTWKSKDVKNWREIKCRACLLHSWPRVPGKCGGCNDADSAKAETKEPEEQLLSWGRGREGAPLEGQETWKERKGEGNEGREALPSFLTVHINFQRTKGGNVKGKVLRQTVYFWPQGGQIP